MSVIELAAILQNGGVVESGIFSTKVCEVLSGLVDFSYSRLEKEICSHCSTALVLYTVKSKRLLMEIAVILFRFR